jgi:hypothetical protein
MSKTVVEWPGSKWNSKSGYLPINPEKNALYPDRSFLRRKTPKIEPVEKNKITGLHGRAPAEAFALKKALHSLPLIATAPMAFQKELCY